MHSRLPNDTLLQMVPLLGSLSRLIAKGTQVREIELRTLLLGVDLDAEPSVTQEAKRWLQLLQALCQNPTEELRQVTVEALLLRGLPEASVLLAVSVVTEGASKLKLMTTRETVEVPVSSQQSDMLNQSNSTRIFSSQSIAIVHVKEGKELGRIYEVRKDSLSIGRSRESDIFLEDLAVSRLHASITRLGDGNYALKDEGSANGTAINGQVVNKNQHYPLQDGDEIELGETVLVFDKR